MSPEPADLSEAGWGQAELEASMAYWAAHAVDYDAGRLSGATFDACAFYVKFVLPHLAAASAHEQSAPVPTPHSPLEGVPRVRAMDAAAARRASRRGRWLA